MDENPCIHWWKIPTPDGPTSKGVCRYCGAERIFSNDYSLIKRGFTEAVYALDELNVDRLISPVTVR